MSQKIKTMKDLSKVLQSKINNILNCVANDVKSEIDNALKRYYDEYDPELGKSIGDIYYHRIDKLKNCCKIIRSSNNLIEIYLDIDSLNYETKGADPYKTVRAGDAGLHGGWNTSDIESGQVPWSIVSNSEIGDRYGEGTQIWSEPMEELFDNGKLIASFKKHAKKYGLTIK